MVGKLEKTQAPLSINGELEEGGKQVECGPNQWEFVLGTTTPDRCFGAGNRKNTGKTMRLKPNTGVTRREMNYNRPQVTSLPKELHAGRGGKWP